MNKERLHQEISSIERKLLLLVQAHKELQQKNAALEAENRQLKGQISSKEQDLERFQNKIKISNLVTGIKAEENDPSGLKNRISDYIKEIDQCIAFLSK